MKLAQNLFQRIRSLPEGSRRIVAGILLLLAALLLLSAWSIRISSSIETLSPAGEYAVQALPPPPVPQEILSPTAGILESVKSAETTLRNGFLERFMKGALGENPKKKTRPAPPSFPHFFEGIEDGVQRALEYMYARWGRTVEP